MFSAKYQPYIYSFCMSLSMSCIMSLVISLHNLGWVNNIINIWLQAWGFGFMVAFPTVLLVSPIVRKIVKYLVKNNEIQRQN